MVNSRPINNAIAQQIGSERLLGIQDICALTGLKEVTAAKLMKESGKAIRLHRRLFVLDTSFFNYLREVEVKNPCCYFIYVMHTH